MNKIKSKILGIKEVNPSVRLFEVEVSKNFEFSPGQYIFIEIGINGENIRRAYSIADYNKEKSSIELCIKKAVEGSFVEKLFKLKKDSEIKILGPLGKFCLNQIPESKEYIFIATGTGIAPFKAMIKSLGNKKRILLQGYRTENDELYKNEFKNVEKKTIFSKPKNKDSKKGYVQELIKEIELNKNANYLICGLSDMIIEVKKKLTDSGIPEEKIFFEKYG